MTYGIEALLFIVTASVITYLTARKMNVIYTECDDYIKNRELTKDEKKEWQLCCKRKCKSVLYIAFAFLIGMLLYAKTGRWIVESVYSLLSLSTENMLEVIIPLGISYYTFSAVAYLADVYWRKQKPEENYFKFALFLIYFPKILQGPISRYKNLAHQLTSEHEFNYKQFCFGIQLMVWGYFKKIVIADRLAVVVNEVFHNYENYSGGYFIVAAVFGAIQLYCDFSGCMDIARGFSQALGIELEANFERPFFSRSAAEFWRRWHMTLGTWFKDYVYMPLVISPKLIKIAQSTKVKFGNRMGKAILTIIPSAIVWILTGLWHGTGWNYILWGIYWGTVIICSTVFEPEIKQLTKILKINTATSSWKVFQMVRTFFLFVGGRMLTIPKDINALWEIIKKIFTEFKLEIFFDGSLYKLGLNRANFTLALVTILILWIVSMLQERGSVREKIAKYNIVFRWTVYYIAVFSIIVFGMYGPGYDASSFVYMQY